MPAQPLTAAQKEDAARLKAIYEGKKAELHLTQITLAALCGWESQGSVSQYLNGKIPLNVDAAAKLARGLKCSIDDFSPALAQELRAMGSGLANAPPAEEEITFPDVAPPPDQSYPRLQALEQRTITRPPLTDDEWIIMDGWRIASEEVRHEILSKCLLALHLHGHRAGDIQKKA